MRVLVVDDHVLFRRCMIDYLAGHGDITVIGEASVPARALELVQTQQPDIALVDIDLGGRDGLRLVTEIAAAAPACSVVMLTASHNEASMARAVEAGAVGYLVKDIAPESLVQALRRVADGDTVFPRSFLVHQVFKNIRAGSQAPEDHAAARLTEREIEILRLVADGLMDKQIAAQLDLSENTVKKHMQGVRKKLGASNRVQAAMIGMQKGVIDPPRDDTDD